MLEFALDGSNYFDFATKNRKDYVVKGGSQLPVLEIFPIKTENFSQLLRYITNASVTFSMYNDTGYYHILDSPAIFNLKTPLNLLNDQKDSCNEFLDFTIQYFFSTRDLNKPGTYSGKFKIKFYGEDGDKTLIVPIYYPLRVTVLS